MNEPITSDDFPEYGRWARDNQIHLSAVSTWVLIEKGNVPQSNKRAYNMTDEKADKIDKALCALAGHNPHLAQVFHQHYVQGASYKDLAHLHKCSKSTIKNKLDYAGGYVCGVASNL